MHIVMLVAAMLLGGCTSFNLLYDAMLATTAGCPTEKILFTQTEGCLNDDSFEFCVPDDPALLADLHEEVPNITCIPSAGRARCDTETQVLCLVATEGLCRPDQPNALTDTGWELACNIAARPYIEQLVPTWYE